MRIDMGDQNDRHGQLANKKNQ